MARRMFALGQMRPSARSGTAAYHPGAEVGRREVGLPLTDPPEPITVASKPRSCKSRRLRAPATVRHEPITATRPWAQRGRQWFALPQGGNTVSISFCITAGASVFLSTESCPLAPCGSAGVPDRRRRGFRAGGQYRLHILLYYSRRFSFLVDRILPFGPMQPSWVPDRRWRGFRAGGQCRLHIPLYDGGWQGGYDGRP